MLNQPGIDQVRDATTPTEMRAEIARQRHYNVVVCSVLDAADHTGLSGEDRYAMLAYYALVALGRAETVIHDHMLRMPPPIIVGPND